MADKHKSTPTITALAEFADKEYLDRFVTTWKLKIPKPIWVFGFLTLLGLIVSLLFLFYMPWVQTIVAAQPNHHGSQ